MPFERGEILFSKAEGMNIVLRAVCMLLILLVGHAINIGLCTISSLVHPLRLIFVEYYKNAEFEGGGKEYRPFKTAWANEVCLSIIKSKLNNNKKIN